MRARCSAVTKASADTKRHRTEIVINNVVFETKFRVKFGARPEFKKVTEPHLLCTVTSSGMLAGRTLAELWVSSLRD